MRGNSITPKNLTPLLEALGEQLGQQAHHFGLVVVGGSALLALGLIDRTTLDVDVVALTTPSGLQSPEPLPAPLVLARDRVARDFAVASDWLNTGPAGLLDFGLPDGFLTRTTPVAFGAALTVYFASRVDQIHLKLYAMADQGAGRHEHNLHALQPTPDELVIAARWTLTHDPSEPFLVVLRETLAHLGVVDADLAT